jgi:hypothetical protein
MLGRGGHDRHAAPSNEVDTIGGVVRLPQVRTLRIPPDASQRSIVGQMIQRHAGQRLAVKMVGELWRVDGHDSGGVTSARKRWSAGFPLPVQAGQPNLHSGQAITSSHANIEL